ncbi:MAG TPA: hypothetical protein GXX25_10120 [Desulfotomaculum sp.]|uniref:hypothetical protein n=1 Tax=Desulfofundulus thermobenzoicus TaxID=29376 RepID=UPI00128F889F|nr:hypothetical protein [Desulfofundulus thermobenzoicus]HHW44141.1 hypothetical protein [Desulfotomaculum sp.]
MDRHVPDAGTGPFEKGRPPFYADYRVFHPLIEKMLREGVRLEQECIEPAEFIRVGEQC